MPNPNGPLANLAHRGRSVNDISRPSDIMYEQLPVGSRPCHYIFGIDIVTALRDPQCRTEADKTKKRRRKAELMAQCCEKIAAMVDGQGTRQHT